MRVLITSPVFPPDLGGPGTYVPHIGRYLVDRGHTLSVVAFCSDPAPSGYPFKVIAIRPGFWPLRYAKAFYLVWREARSHDVVYVQEHLALFHVLAARLAGVPAVIRIMVDGAWEIAYRRGWCGGDDHDTFQSRKYGWRVRLIRRLQKQWWRWSRQIIACSEYLRQILIQSYGVPPEKVKRIYNAYNGPSRADFPETRAEARAKLGLAGDPRYLLTVSRLVDWKGVDLVMRAMTGLPREVHLLVAGDGEMLEPWRELARELDLADRVQFLGNVPHEKIPLYIRAAEIFVLDSEYEGLSHTLLEVSSIGTAIIASEVCGNPEVVEDEVNGLLVPPRDVPALARAVTRLLGDADARHRFIEAGLGRTARFSRARTYAEVEQTLEAAAKTRRRS